MPLTPLPEPPGEGDCRRRPRRSREGGGLCSPPPTPSLLQRLLGRKGERGRGKRGVSVMGTAVAEDPTSATRLADADAPLATTPGEDVLMSGILQKVGALVDGRLAAILDRLPPELPGKFRPLLKGDRGRDFRPLSRRGKGSREFSLPRKKGAKPRTARSFPNSGKAARRPLPPIGPALSPSPLPAGGRWCSAERRKRRRLGRGVMLADVGSRLPLPRLKRDGEAKRPGPPPLPGRKAGGRLPPHPLVYGRPARRR